ncbi:AmmeMemoRadiSam system protein B [Candidatus Uhrbacteria bacterium]|nr:AmmeMemoRadiSam system protein B [Candidatus Uhrbacteria bacterium]
MKRKLILPIVIATALAAAAFGIVFSLRTPSTDRGVADPDNLQSLSAPRINRTRNPIDTAFFIDTKRFSSVWSSTHDVTYVSGKVVAGVVNHHFLAADLIARFFTDLKASSPDAKRIIILSPDHFFSGRGPISVHDRDYATPDGILESDRPFVASLVSSTSVALEDGIMFEAEHGIGTLAPFIKHEFPDAKIVGIAMQGTMDRGLARSFGEELSSLIDDRTIVIVSSDMSHYLPAGQALKNDEITISELKDLNQVFFARAKDDFIDNGVALVALAGFFDAQKAVPYFTLLDHGISSDYLDDDKNTTSYINGIWAVEQMASCH